MHISRNKVLVVAGALVAVVTGILLLRPKPKPGNDSIAGLQEDFRVRNAVASEVSAAEIIAERVLITNAAQAKLREAGLASGNESALAEAFAGLVTAYRSPTAEQFVEFYATRDTPLEPARAEQRRQGWQKANIMTDGRRVDLESLAVSTIVKNPSTVVIDSGKSRFYSWIRPELAAERALTIGPNTPVTCLTIRILAQQSGPGSAFNLTIGFVRSGKGTWLPVMNLIDGATERPVYHLPI